MTNRIRGALPVALAIAAVAAPSAAAAPVSVNLRVEGASSTIFDGPVTTDGHSSQPRRPAGPSPATAPTPGPSRPPVPTATAALDDGARINGFAWDADWFSSFSDFSVKQVAGEAANTTQFWGHRELAGGHRGRLPDAAQGGDEWYGPSTPSARRPSCGYRSDTATIGTPVSFRRPTPGRPRRAGRRALVNGTPTGSNGVATVTFPAEGIFRIKADRANALRSNSIRICVDPAGAGPAARPTPAAPRPASARAGQAGGPPARRAVRARC